MLTGLTVVYVDETAAVVHGRDNESLSVPCRRRRNWLADDGSRGLQSGIAIRINSPDMATIGRGQFDGGPGNYWKGAIDNVAVYSTALTAEQVTDVFETTKPGFPPPPVPAPDPSTYADGILNGTWDYTLGPEDAQLIIENYAGFVDDADEVTIRVGFDNHEYWQGVVFDGKLILENGFPEGSAGTIFIEEDILILDESLVLGFSLDGDDLALDWLELCVGDACRDTPLDPFELIVLEHTFTKSSDDPSY